MVFKIVFLLVIINLFSKIESTKPKIEFLAVVNIKYNFFFLFIYCFFHINFIQLKVFRHGDRAPDNGREQYPNDPYKNYEYFPEGHGGLTNVSIYHQFVAQ